MSLPVVTDDGEPLEHELLFDHDGDGWTEPFSESWTCNCGTSISDWVQRDPEHSGKPELSDILHAHAAHVATTVADERRLLGPARMVLDRAAEGEASREECAAMAQRIVDMIGHSVTDEPPRALRLLDLLADEDRALNLIGHSMIGKPAVESAYAILASLREVATAQPGNPALGR